MNKKTKSNLSLILMWGFSLIAFILLAFSIIELRSQVFYKTIPRLSSSLNLKTIDILVCLSIGIFCLIIAKIFSNINNKGNN